VYAFGHHWGFTRDQYPDGYRRFRDEDVLSVGSFPITEGSPPAPRDPYSVSKLLNEQTAAAVTTAQGLETVGLRFGDIWFDALQTWWKDPPRPARPRPGEKFDFWNYVDAGDAARAVAAAVAVDTVRDPLVVFVMADDTQVRADTRDALASSFPELLDRVPADLQGRSSLFSNRRARETLGWSPRVSWTDFEPS
jgi:nucleoside-diphosphate-sugar epimerase